MSSKTRATIEALYQVEGKAELVAGEIVYMPLRKGSSRSAPTTSLQEPCSCETSIY